MDAVSDRDFLVDGVYAATMALTHLSRVAEEIVLWSSTEFGFVSLPDDHATGSSMMPQKKNPDVAEVARGSSGLAVGALTGLLVTLKGLPLAYDRDLQLDKTHVRNIFFTTPIALRAMAGLLAGVTFDVERLASAASDPGLLATDEAEALVRRGVPFRKAHETIAAKAANGELAQGDAHSSIEARTMPGGPSPKSVRAQVRRLRKRVQT
jgi:argininosuccinate lyase